MAYAHTIAKPERGCAITVGKAYTPGDVTLNFGETVSVVLTPAQLNEALVSIQAAIDEHMKLRPVAAA